MNKKTLQANESLEGLFTPIVRRSFGLYYTHAQYIVVGFFIYRGFFKPCHYMLWLVGVISYHKPHQKENQNSSNKLAWHNKNSEFGLVWRLEFVLNSMWVKQTTSKFDFLVLPYTESYIKNA